MVKSGRTHWMDAVPVTLGQEFGGYAAQVRQGIARVQRRAAAARPDPARRHRRRHRASTRIPSSPRGCARSSPRRPASRSPRRPIRSRRRRRATGIVEASGALKTVAVSLTKIANDLRFMGSGPRAGLAEISLPELQKGSSIMPGKVNPVIPEVVTQVAAQVIGNDLAITVGGMQGHFELNVFVPLIARNILDSVKLLASALPALRREVRRRDRGATRAVRALCRADALGGDRAQPVHRLRQGERDRQGSRRVGPVAARGRPREGRRGVRPGRGARLPRDGQAARRVAHVPGPSSLDAPAVNGAVLAEPLVRSTLGRLHLGLGTGHRPRSANAGGERRTSCPALVSEGRQDAAARPMVAVRGSSVSTLCALVALSAVSAAGATGLPRRPNRRGRLRDVDPRDHAARRFEQAADGRSSSSRATRSRSQTPTRRRALSE